jgi:XTP/dITP diphosphohydrolase
MTLWFMTSNKGKVIEVREHFSHLGIPVKQFEFEAIEPQSDDLEIVALSKIEQAISHLPNPDDMLLVEDAGLFIDALNGFPGVYSAYALETLGVHGILKLMEHLRSENPIQDGNLRSAEFRAVAVLYHNGQTTVAEGVCPGRISHHPVEGDGFGFDPIFIPADLDADGNALEVGQIGVTSTHGTSFGGISLEEKQLYSHRRRALSSLLSNLDRLG